MLRSSFGLFGPLMGVFMAQWFTGIAIDFVLDVLTLGALYLWLKYK